jgi:hypothetical protein
MANNKINGTTGAFTNTSAAEVVNEHNQMQ